MCTIICLIHLNLILKFGNTPILPSTIRFREVNTEKLNKTAFIAHRHQNFQGIENQFFYKGIYVGIFMNILFH